jgi:FAD/FMN-containing dehydrogenase
MYTTAPVIPLGSMQKPYKKKRGANGPEGASEPNSRENHRLERRGLPSTKAMVWPQNTPGRYPQMIVQAANQNDVVQAAKFARGTGLKVAVRGGGHNWVGYALRDDSLLIDLGQLNKASIDNKARIARIQPAITGRELNRLLVADDCSVSASHPFLA